MLDSQLSLVHETVGVAETRVEMIRVKDEMTVKVRAATNKTDCQNIEVRQGAPRHLQHEERGHLTGGGGSSHSVASRGDNVRQSPMSLVRIGPDTVF